MSERMDRTERWGMRYGMCTDEQAKQAALDYQQTKDINLFNKFLEKFDDLLVNTIHQLRRRYSYLKNVEAEDMYQNAVLSLYKVITKIKEKHNANYLAYMVKSRIITELLRTYRYLDKESVKRQDFSEVPQQLCTTSYNSSNCDATTIQAMLKLRGTDKDCFIRHFFQGESMTSIAIDYHISRSSVSVRLRKIMKKLRKLLGKDLKSEE